MLNLIKAIIVTMITLIVSFISFIRGPILVGLIALVSIVAFTKNASASMVNDCGIALSCTYPSPVSLWNAMSFSQNMAVIMWVIGCITMFVLVLKDKKAKAIQKTKFQIELDAAIKAHNNR